MTATDGVDGDEGGPLYFARHPVLFTGRQLNVVDHDDHRD
jgi:hypothetical protein